MNDKTLNLKMYLHYMHYNLSTLPVNIISFISIVPVLSIYRSYLAQVLHNMPNKSILEPKFNPVLAVMPKIGEYPELLRYLALVWDYKYKSLKRSEKVNIYLIVLVFGIINKVILYI